MSDARPFPSKTEAATDGGLNAIVVEDNETDSWFFSEVLRRRGCNVVSCGSGEEALEVVAEEMPDLVLLDLLLPGMRGLDVCREIRAKDGGDHPFVMVVTSLDEAAELAEVLAAGADDILRKPIQSATLIVHLDIAERRIEDGRDLRRAQAALRAKSRELETLFNNLRDVFFSLELTDNALIQISPSAEAMFEVSMESLTGPEAAWRRYVLPGAAALDAAKVEPGDSHVVEYPIVTGAGTTRFIRASLKVDEAEDGPGSLRVYGILVDATEEIAARTELAVRNHELETLHRLADLALSAGSLEEAYDEMLDLISEAMGCGVVAIERLDRERDRLVVSAARGIPAAANGPLEIPLHRTPSGRAIRSREPVLERDASAAADLTASGLTDLRLAVFASFPLIVGGEATGTMMLGDTARIELDDHFARMGISLATTVAGYIERLEATEAIRESEVRHRTLATQLKHANQELESFAYSVSHDLRAPLRTMQGFAYSLVQNFGDQLAPEARDYAQRIIASGQQSERLINDLLAYSRLSSERLELMPVDLKTVVDQALEQVHSDLEKDGAVVTVDDPLPTVRANLTALVQVVANLVSNASKFVPSERTPEVRIRAEEKAHRVRLWVEDNGVGVPVGQEERIFRVFERLAESGHRPGTGIGLAIVRRVAQRIEGSCGVERRPEGGSAFWIEMAGDRPTWRTGRRPL